MTKTHKRPRHVKLSKKSKRPNKSKRPTKSKRPNESKRPKRKKITKRRRLKRENCRQGGGGAPSILPSDIELLSNEGIQIVREHGGNLSCIGKGSYGSVYNAIYDGDRVAVKVMDYDINYRNEIRNLILLEGTKGVIQIKTQKRGRFIEPHVIFLPPTRAGAGNRVVIVMEVILGEDLFEWRRDGLYESAIPIIMKNLLFSLKGIHDANLIHGDLKLENVMIIEGESGIEIKIIDLGFAKIVEGPIQCSDIMGTCAYIAPEVVRGYDDDGSSCDGRAVDMYAIGVLMYVLIYGDTPFHSRPHDGITSNSTRDRKNLITAETPIFPTGVEFQGKYDTANKMILELLHGDPAKRLDCSSALDHDYFIENEPPDEYIKGRDHRKAYMRLERAHQARHTEDQWEFDEKSEAKGCMCSKEYPNCGENGWCVADDGNYSRFNTCGGQLRGCTRSRMLE